MGLTNEFNSQAKEVELHQSIVSACFKDRCSLIVPTGLTPLVKAYAKEILKIYPCTGILVQKYKTNYFYHATTEVGLAGILKEGFRLEAPANGIDNSSFGWDVIYSFDDVDKLRLEDGSLPPIAMISYTGPYLKAIYEQDKTEQYQGACMLYPAFINHVCSYTE